MRELLNLENCTTICNILPDVLTELNQIILRVNRPKKRLLELMCSYIKPKNLIIETKKKCTIEFYTTLEQIFIDKKGRVCEIEVKKFYIYFNFKIYYYKIRLKMFIQQVIKHTKCHAIY